MESKYLLRLVDPKLFTDADLPLIVLADDRRGFFGWAIRNHTSGNWNHAMIMHKPGLLASQGFDCFKEIKLDAYLNDRQMLKFWRLKDMTPGEANTIQRAVTRRLALPWYKRGYDWLGIAGQFLRLKFIQNPMQTFCSEEVRNDYVGEIPRAFKVVSKQPSPSDLDRIFRTNPKLFDCLGYYFED